MSQIFKDLFNNMYHKYVSFDKQTSAMTKRSSIYDETQIWIFSELFPPATLFDTKIIVLGLP